MNDKVWPKEGDVMYEPSGRAWIYHEGQWVIAETNFGGTLTPSYKRGGPEFRDKETGRPFKKY